MSGNCQRSEGTEVTTILECDQTEGNDNEEDGLFVHMPAKQEGGIATESDRSDKSIPRRTQPKFNKTQLDKSVQIASIYRAPETYQLENKSKSKSLFLCDFWQDRK